MLDHGALDAHADRPRLNLAGGSDPNNQGDKSGLPGGLPSGAGGPGGRGGFTPAAPNTAYGYGSNVLGETEVHLLDYVKVLYKRRWTAIATFLVIFLAVTIYTFTVTPMYEAKVQILIEKENDNVVTFKEAFEQNQATDDYYQTQYKILQSRSLARKTIDSLDIWNDPLLADRSDTEASVPQSIKRPFYYVLGLFTSRAPAEPPEANETAQQSKIIDRFLYDLTVTPVRNSRLVEVRFESRHPAFAATIANALAKNYIDQSLEFKFQASKQASDWLGGQLSEQRGKVESSEAALQKYREQNDALSLEERQNIVVQKLADLNGAVTRAKTDRIQKEALYNQIKAIQHDRTALESFPAILSNAFIQQEKTEIAGLQQQQTQLAEKLGPRHPDMLKIASAIEAADVKMRAEVAKVVQSMKNDYEAAVLQEHSLAAALEQQKHDALELNRKGIDYGVLQRDASTNRQIFESLLQRTKETGISGELKNSNIRVVDAAELPRAPVRPKKLINELLALFGGALLAVGVAFFSEYIDNRIKTPDEVKNLLGIPFLGMVPVVFDEHVQNPRLGKGAPTSFAEAVRAVRTNVLFSSAASGGRSIVVTSTGPGEGKTLMAGNLAIALAQAGQRVLLVDADLRRPRVQEVFEITRQPGLSNVMVGDTKASEAVQKTDTQNLWILPAGMIPPNPAELLGSKRFNDFVATLVQHFDWVIIDTPPVMAVTDSALVAHMANGVLFVIGAEMTSRYAAQRAVEQLRTANATFLGGILNRVDLKHNAYYYSQYYKREYADYYTETKVQTVA